MGGLNERSRIGGKAMIHERDRIQENANEYIVRNCPSCIISPSCCAKYHIDNGHAKDCQDITDCVIKQVIEKCKEHPFKDCACGDEILQLFDIEEINK